MSSKSVEEKYLVIYKLVLSPFTEICSRENVDFVGFLISLCIYIFLCLLLFLWTRQCELVYIFMGVHSGHRTRLQIPWSWSYTSGASREDPSGLHHGLFVRFIHSRARQVTIAKCNKETGRHRGDGSVARMCHRAEG